MKRRRRTKDLRSLGHEEVLAELGPEWAELAGIQKARGRVVRMALIHRGLGRQHLNAIIFPDRLHMDGLSLASLLALPGEELVGVIPDDKGLRQGDVVTALMHHRATHRTVALPSFSVCDGQAPITLRYNRAVLTQFGANGAVDFSYEVRDASGAVIVRSPMSRLNVMLHGMPGHLMAPVVRRGEDGVVRESDIVPELVVEIPVGKPACRGGDRVYLRMGDAFFEPITLGKLEATLDPMGKLLVPCDDVLRLATEYRKGVFTLEVSYDVEREGILSASPVTIVDFDLSATFVPEKAPVAS
jgi:hypothetical protein